MAKAGYDPHTSITFWARGTEVFGGGDDGTAFFSTHPLNSERQKRLQELLPIAMQYYNPKQKISQPKRR
jgi:predicted Zn-dependent protease